MFTSILALFFLLRNDPIYLTKFVRIFQRLVIVRALCVRLCIKMVWKIRAQSNSKCCSYTRDGHTLRTKEVKTIEAIIERAATQFLV